MNRFLVAVLGILTSSLSLARGDSTITTFAGSPPTNYLFPFASPTGVVVDPNTGSLYVADDVNDLVYEVQESGVTIVAGTTGKIGSVDGYSGSELNGSAGIAEDLNGNFFVADAKNNTIREISTSGYVSTFAGLAGNPGSADGTGSTARFNNPRSVAVDSNGNVYVADAGNNTIREITQLGVVTTLAGSPGVNGSADGTGAAASFNDPESVAVDSSGNVFVTDSANYTIRKITTSGVVTTVAGSAGQYGSADGTGAAARFDYPEGVATDPTGHGYLYVADTSNHTIRKISSSGAVTTLAGLAGEYGSADGSKSKARFNFPVGVSADAYGNIFVADDDNQSIRRVSSAGAVITVLGAGNNQGFRDGTGPAAQFRDPSGVATDASGNVYVADNANQTVRVITPAGVVTTFAGSPGVGGTVDGTGSAARFSGPDGIAVDTIGNIYVADANNNAIRKITPGGVVTTLAGLPGLMNKGSNDGTGTAARFNLPLGIAVDSGGNVYVSDTGNSTIRKITPAGVVTTFAGAVGQVGSQDGMGNVARFYHPEGLAVDAGGNVYVADAANDEIRKITPAGLVTTFAGSAEASGSSDGFGTSAQFYFPQFLAVDAFGNVFVSDSFNFTIREITPDGEVTTLAGYPRYGGSSDGVGRAAMFYNPYGIAVDLSGNFYVADASNNIIRKGVSPRTKAAVTLNVPKFQYDGTPKAATATTKPAGLAVVLAYDNSTTPPTAAGTYSVVATISDPTYMGVANGTLVISPGTATVTLSDLAATYDGAAHAASATTSPSGLDVTLTYGGSTTVPVNAGSYAVVATVSDPNYSGSAKGTLVIAKGAATVTFGNLNLSFDGAAQSATATTNPPGLVVTYTYNGKTTLPINPGSYAVVATVNTPNATGMATNTLTISLAPPTVYLGAADADVSAWVNPNGVATSAYVEYGLTNAYGTQVPTTPMSAGNGKVPIDINIFLSGLMPHTLYHYRVVTVTASGTVDGQDETFMTPSFDTALVAASGSTYAGFGSAAVDASDEVAFIGNVTMGTAATSGIWANHGTATLNLIAQTGSAAPGTNGALFATLTDPVYNNGADVAFGGSLKLATGLAAKTTANGVWVTSGGITPDLLAREGSAAPGVGGATFATFTAIGLTDSAGAIISGTVAGGSPAVSKTNNAGVWEGSTSNSLTLMLRAGETVGTGSGTKTIASFKFLPVETVVNGQTRGFSPTTGHLVATATYTDKTTGIIDVTSATHPAAAATSGDAAAGISDATFATFSNPAIDDSDDVAFLATVKGSGLSTTNDTGIWTETGGTLNLIAQTGANAPDASGASLGAPFATLTDPVENANGAVAFVATLKLAKGQTGASGIWCDSTGSLTLAVRQGGQAAGCPTGVTYSTFTSLALDDVGGSTQQGGVIFVATLAGVGVGKTNATGIFAVDNAGAVQLIVRTGDTFGTKTVTALSFLPVETTTNTLVAGQTRSFSASTGDLVYNATFDDKSTAIYNVVFP